LLHALSDRYFRGRFSLSSRPQQTTRLPSARRFSLRLLTARWQWRRPA
jgi:hypothetical protein